jgi:hypothetical protein
MARRTDAAADPRVHHDRGLGAGAGEGVRTGSGGGHDAGRRLVQGGQVQLTAADGGSVAGEEGLQAGDPPWPGLRDGLVWANQPDSGTLND